MIDGGVYELEGWVVATIDGRKVESKDDLLDVFAEELRFPDYFGRNWDAVFDCLADMSWLPAGGYLIVWQRADVLANAEPDSFATAVDILRDAAFAWKERGTPFVVLMST